MKISLPTTHTRAVTLIESLIIVAILLILVAMLLPAYMKRHARSSRINCTNNLKQVALAFHTWAGDNQQLFPMQVSTNLGGTMELGAGPNLFICLQVLSNELNTPRILFCPEDTDPTRKQATTFATSVTAPQQVAFIGNSNMSYFIGLDTNYAAPQSFLSGDRNLTNGLPLRDGVLEATTNRPVGWTAGPHKDRGNIGLADASVTMLATPEVRNALKHTGLETNRLAMP